MNLFGSITIIYKSFYNIVEVNLLLSKKVMFGKPIGQKEN